MSEKQFYERQFFSISDCCRALFIVGNLNKRSHHGTSLVWYRSISTGIRERQSLSFWKVFSDGFASFSTKYNFLHHYTWARQQDHKLFFSLVFFKNYFLVLLFYFGQKIKSLDRKLKSKRKQKQKCFLDNKN